MVSPRLFGGKGSSAFFIASGINDNRKDAESAKKRYFSFAVDPPKIPADRKDGKGKSISVYIVITICFYIKLLFPVGMNFLLLSALLSRFS